MRSDRPEEVDERADAFVHSLARFEALRVDESDGILPACRSQLFHHGRPTQRAFLLFHGFTNCPAQFKLLAEALHARGHNVFAPLAEGHGRRDGSPVGLTRLTADGLAQWTDDSVRLASGLGDMLEVVGFSFGGVCATWAARQHDEVSRVTLIAPAFLPYSYPVSMHEMLPGALRLLPESYIWWDPVRRNAAPLGPHGYRQVSRRGIASVYELGNRAWRTQARRTTRMHRATLVLNDRDFAVSAPAAKRAFDEAIAPLADHRDVRRLGAELRLPHDYIDPFGRTAEHAQENLHLLLEILGETG